MRKEGMITSIFKILLLDCKDEMKFCFEEINIINSSVPQSGFQNGFLVFSPEKYIIL